MRFRTTCRRVTFFSVKQISFIFVVCTSFALAQTPVAAGFRDFSFGLTTTGTPTAEKPESKLWWNDGIWWGSLYSNQAQAHRIYRFDAATRSWSDTGVTVDDRNSSRADVLWDATTRKLYVASHVFSNTGKVTTSSEWARLWRFSYNSATKTYTKDPGFPVAISQGKGEALTIARDSVGKLWVTYVEGDTVYINRSMGTDNVWGTPFALPLPSASGLTLDDISAVIAFAGDRIGVMWSNQATGKFYLASHLDGHPDDLWQAEEIAFPALGGLGDADDHINLKTDDAGNIYAAVKTSLTNSDAPLVMLLKRDSFTRKWSSYTFGRVRDHHTRPIVQLDVGRRLIYLFATSGESGGAIYLKTTSMDNIGFPVGKGTAVVQSASDFRINNASSTKQNVNATTGLLIVATDQDSRLYFHNYFSLQ